MTILPPSFFPLLSLIFILCLLVFFIRTASVLYSLSLTLQEALLSQRGRAMLRVYLPRAQSFIIISYFGFRVTNAYNSSLFCSLQTICPAWCHEQDSLMRGLSLSDGLCDKQTPPL